MMIKILLSLTIWLRKYQGRGGNYYTICNATSILVTTIYLALFLVRSLLYNQYAPPIDRSVIGIIILMIGIVIGFLLLCTLMHKLRKRNIYLHFKQYRQNVYSIALLWILLSILLMILQFLEKEY